MSGKTFAPWSEEEVRALNAYQRSGEFHEFTCGNDHEWDAALIAKPDGWACPHCDYRQTWAHKFMVDHGRAKLAQGDLFPAPIAAGRMGNE